MFGTRAICADTEMDWGYALHVSERSTLFRVGRFILRWIQVVILCAFATLLGLTACNRIPTATVEGNVHVVMAMAFGATKDHLFDLINSNYMVQGDTAYYLWFKPDTKIVGMDRQTKGNGMIIPVPKKLGTVVIYTGARYRARGQVIEPDSKNASLLLSKNSPSKSLEEMYIKSQMAEVAKTYNDLPVKILGLEYFELVQPAPTQ
jgi:hypothetical protein